MPEVLSNLIRGGVSAFAAETPIPWVKRLSTPRIVGDVGGTALATLALTAARQYYIPFMVPRQVTLSGLRISVTTASAGQANLGLYGSAVASGSDVPGAMLAAITATLDTGTTGDKTGNFASQLVLTPGTLYWAALIGSAAATVRALAVAAIQTSLGRQVNNTGVISHLFAAGSGSTLPATAPTLSDGTGSIPAIYLIEV